MTHYIYTGTNERITLRSSVGEQFPLDRNTPTYLPDHMEQIAFENQCVRWDGRAINAPRRKILVEFPNAAAEVFASINALALMHEWFPLNEIIVRCPPAYAALLPAYCSAIASMKAGQRALYYRHYRLGLREWPWLFNNQLHLIQHGYPKLFALGIGAVKGDADKFQLRQWDWIETRNDYIAVIGNGWPELKERLASERGFRICNEFSEIANAAYVVELGITGSAYLAAYLGKSMFGFLPQAGYKLHVATLVKQGKYEYSHIKLDSDFDKIVRVLRERVGDNGSPRKTETHTDDAGDADGAGGREPGAGRFGDSENRRRGQRPTEVRPKMGRKNR